MNDEQRTHVITSQEFDARLALGCCPRCASYGHITARLAKRFRAYENPETGRVTFRGCYYECPENGWKHYCLSPGNSKNKPRETSW